MEADELFLPLRSGADHDEDALRLGLHPGLEVDAVRPDVDVATRREIAVLPALVLRLPLGREPRDHAGRQVGRLGSEDGRERLLEIAGGDAAQVENGQQGVEAPRATGPLRQDVRREPDLLAARHVRSAIPDLRAPELEGADAGLDLPFGSVPVPNHALPTIRKPLLGEPVEEGLDLGFERGHEHPARTFPGNLGERVLDRTRLAQRDDAGIVLHGVSLLLEVLAGSTPATIRRPLNPHHPSSAIAPGLRTKVSPSDIRYRFAVLRGQFDLAGQQVAELIRFSLDGMRHAWSCFPNSGVHTGHPCPHPGASS